MINMRGIALLALPALAAAFPDGQARTPPLGWNSWNYYGASVSAADLRSAAEFLASSGLRDAGFQYVSTDDGWLSGIVIVKGCIVG